MVLLKLKLGSALLIKELLNNALGGEDDKSDKQDRNLSLYNARNALKEVGVTHITCEQAKEILYLRTDFSELN